MLLRWGSFLQGTRRILVFPADERFWPCTRWAGAAVGGDGCIYFAPYQSDGVLVVNPREDTAVVKFKGVGGGGKW